MPIPSALVARQFSSLKNWNYRVYFFGQMVSIIGTWMQTTGQAWLVLKLTGSFASAGTGSINGTVSAVPLPAAILLLGPALAGLGVMSRRRRDEAIPAA